MSKVVIVNSTMIQEYASEFNTNIWQIPSIVDTNRFSYKKVDQGTRRSCIGWSGSPTTLKNLKMVEEPLRRISEMDISDIYFIGGTEFDLKGVDYKAQKWFEESEVEDLRRIDIGLVPLPENSWNRYKFIMKAAQYMALGIVPVGTPMASNTEVIKHGVNGFLASTSDEWVEYLSLLSNDETLRKEMSENAVKDASANYSLEANTPKIIEAFRAALL